MGVRLKTDSDYIRNKDFPGPTAYYPTSIEMANSSSFIVSNFKLFCFYSEDLLLQNCMRRAWYNSKINEKSIIAAYFVT